MNAGGDLNFFEIAAIVGITAFAASKDATFCRLFGGFAALAAICIMVAGGAFTPAGLSAWLIAAILFGVAHARDGDWPSFIRRRRR